MINVISASTPVNAILPLKFALKGKKGINPIILFIHIKKNKLIKMEDIFCNVFLLYWVWLPHHE